MNRLVAALIDAEFRRILRNEPEPTREEIERARDAWFSPLTAKKEMLSLGAIFEAGYRAGRAKQ
jgi:hypothetical protein